MELLADSAAVKPLRSEKKQSWRLKKTLSRKTSFRPIEIEDMKYIWAAYLKGGLNTIGRFRDTKLDANDFTAHFQAEVIQNYSNAWTLFGETAKGSQPIGIILAFWTHPNAIKAPFQIIGAVIRFPWVSKRAWIEGVINFYAKIRNEIPTVIYAHEPDSKRLMEVIAKHGLVRRVGTTFNVVQGEPVAVFETRKGK